MQLHRLLCLLLLKTLKVGTECLACSNKRSVYPSWWVQKLSRVWGKPPRHFLQLRSPSGTIGKPLFFEQFSFPFPGVNALWHFLNKSTVSLNWSTCLKGSALRQNHSPSDIWNSCASNRQECAPWSTRFGPFWHQKPLVRTTDQISSRKMKTFAVKIRRARKPQRNQFTGC